MEQTELYKYIKINISKTNDITKINIYISEKNDQGSQIWISFNYNYNNFLQMQSVLFKNYIKIDTKSIFISNFGYLTKICYELILKTINTNVQYNTKKTFLINIIDDGIVPKIEESMVYTLNKLSNEINNKCPICISDLTLRKEITLKCGHKLCCDCFFESLKNKITKCPLCRTEFV